jgi:hypothetical protein
MTDDLSRKPCTCGKEMVEIIGFSEPDEHRQERYPIRKGWFCFDCRHWEDAILRERTVDISRWLKR